MTNLHNRSSSYLVTLWKLKSNFISFDDKYEKIGEGKILLNTDTNVMEIQAIHNKKLNKLFDVNQSNIYINENTDNPSSNVEIELIMNNIPIFGIEFDKNSASAAKSFIDQFKHIQLNESKITHYESGRHHMIGQETNGNFNGNVKEYHDCPGKYKYIGEMEDGEYDGEGTFYSKNNHLNVYCGNISGGKPLGKGVLMIGNIKTIEIDFREKEIERLDSIDPEYCDKIASVVCEDYKYDLEWFKFTQMTRLEKDRYLFDCFNKCPPNNKKQGNIISRTLFG
jgi:hypothetical protein